MCSKICNKGSSKMELYYFPASAPCRAVQMTAAAVGADLELKFINIGTGEQNKPEYLKINPQHTIPTLVDGDLILWESRAVCVYLVEKFGKKELYPDCPKARAVINQRLYFDMGTLYQKFGDYYYPQIFEKKPADPEQLKAAEEAMGLFNKFLDGNKYAAGDKLTVADICLVATVANYDACSFDLSKFPNVTKWFSSCKSTIPAYNINQAGADQFKQMLS